MSHKISLIINDSDTTPMVQNYTNSHLHTKHIIYTILVCLTINILQASNLLLDTVPHSLQIQYLIVLLVKLFLNMK